MQPIMLDFMESFRKTFIQEDRWKLFLEGFGNTILIALCATFLGILIGVLVASAKVACNNNKNNPMAGGFSRVLYRVLDFTTGLYLTVIRGTPMLIQLLIMYYIIFKNMRNGVPVAIIAFGINSGAYVAETIRSGIMAVDRGQTEAGLSLGLTRLQTMRTIVLPQAIKNILPALGNEFIALLKETSIVGYVMIVDLTRAGDYIRSRTYEQFFPLIAVALIYLVLVLGLTQLLKLFERRLAKSDSH